MDIVEAYLTNSRYIIGISGYVWWDTHRLIVNALSENFKFDVIYVNQMIPLNKMIKSADALDFAKLHEDVNNILNNYRYNGNGGLIIVSPTFPQEKIKFHINLHININVNSVLQTELIVDLVKNNNMNRMDIDTNMAYLARSWKTNRINKTILIQADYKSNINKIYEQIFDYIIENIERKLYGEKYDEIKNKVCTTKYPLPKPGQQTTILTDHTQLSIKTNKILNRANSIGKYLSDIDDIDDSITSMSDKY